MDLAKKKLGLLLSTGPERPENLDTAIGLSEAALARGTGLYLYLIDDGVRALDDPRLQALPTRGAKLFVCAYGCQKRRIALRDVNWLGDGTLEEALNVLKRVRNWRVVDRSLDLSNVEYDAAVRMRLDTTLLPKPFQLSALTSRDSSRLRCMSDARS